MDWLNSWVKKHTRKGKPLDPNLKVFEYEGRKHIGFLWADYDADPSKAAVLHTDYETLVEGKEDIKTIFEYMDRSNLQEDFKPPVDTLA